MSYILDALKKSEQERQAGAVPVLRTAPPVDARRRGLWLGMLVGVAAVLSAAIWLAGPGWLDQFGTPLRIPVISGAGEAAPSTPSASPPSDGTDRTGSADAAPAVRAESTGAVSTGTGLETLDPALQARVKELSVNVVSYSDTPGRRFAMIDQRIVRESESLGEGLVVKRIVPEGVILEVGSREIMVEPQ